MSHRKSVQYQNLTAIGQSGGGDESAGLQSFFGSQGQGAFSFKKLLQDETRKDNKE